MFDDLKKPPEDIFASTEKSEETVPPPFRPQPSNLPSSGPIVPPLSPLVTTQPLLRVKEIGKKNPLKNILIIVVVAVVIIIAGAFLSIWILNSNSEGGTELPNVSQPVDENLIKTTSTDLGIPTPGKVEDKPEVQEKIESDLDTDKDGLTDIKEAELNTNPAKADTDSDGLFDREEVGVYKTNPLVPDTDGDGYLDGDEVKSGYNPNGAGKLFELPESHQ